MLHKTKESYNYSHYNELLDKVNKIFESHHKGVINFSRREIYLIDFSSEIMEVRKKQQDIFQMHQEKA